MANDDDVVSPETPPPAGSSPLMDRCPAEIRLEIFGMVLRAWSGTIRPLSFASTNMPRYYEALWFDHQRHHTEFANVIFRLNTALLTVNRQISSEAEEALYSANCLVVYGPEQLADPDKYKGLRHIRYGHTLTHGSLRDVMHFIKRIIITLPKLKTILMVALALGQDIQWYYNPVKYFRTARDKFDIQCIELGLFEILPSDSFDGKIYLEYAELRRTLPRSLEILSQYEIPTLLQQAYTLPCRGPYTHRQTLELGLPLWMETCDFVREEYNLSMHPGRSADDINNLHIVSKSWFDMLGQLEESIMEMMSTFLPLDVKLKDVYAVKPSAAFLEGMTELLSYGVADALHNHEIVNMEREDEDGALPIPLINDGPRDDQDEELEELIRAWKKETFKAL